MPSFIRATGPDGWLTAGADWGRLIWGAFYWNGQKAWFRARGSRGRAPCQHPSDSGRRGESYCEACVGLSDPRRFVRICPLIRYDSPRGPRCSVGAAEVRPFWGRVVAATGVAGVGAAVIVAGGAWAAFHSLGYRVHASDLLWPPHWGRVREARADYYVRRGFAAYSAGDARGCYLALLEAHALRPGDYATDRLLAQVAEPSDPALADTLFAGLIQSPDGLRAANAAQEWGASLLARCHFGPLAGLSAYMLHRGAGDSAAAWTNALIFATQHRDGSSVTSLLRPGFGGLAGRAGPPTSSWPEPGADPAPLRSLLAEPGALPSDCRTALEWSLQRDSEPLTAALFAAGQSAPSVYLRHYALMRLIRSGNGTRVLDLLANERALPAREMELLRLSAWSQLGWTSERRAEIDRLLRSGAVAPALAEMLAGQLIAYPDRAAAERLFTAVERHPLALTADNYRVYAALTCVAGVDQDALRLKRLTATLGQISGRPFGRESRAAEMFLDRSVNRSVAPILVALQPLSLEVMFEMLSNYPQLPRSPAP